MAKSKKSNNQLLSFIIIAISIATFVFFFLPMFSAKLNLIIATASADSTYFDIVKNGDTLPKILAIVGICIVAWDVLDNILAFCFPKWANLGKIRAFIQLITAVAWIGIMIYFLIDGSKYIAFGAIVLMILAVAQGVFKVLAAKDAIK